MSVPTAGNSEPDDHDRKTDMAKTSNEELLSILIDAIAKTAETDRRIQSLLKEGGMENEWVQILKACR